MLIDLSGKVALVTGSVRGIGLATAKLLAAAGADVLVNSRKDEEPLGDALRSVQAAAKGRVLAVAADVGSREGASALAKAAFESFRRIDILVNNAGLLKEGPIGMISSDDIKAMVDTNLIGVLNMTQAVSRIMGRHKTGAIINLTSIMGRRGRAGQLAYSATKAAVIGATLAAAKELAPSGIRVNAVAPGYIETAMTAHVNEVQKATLLASIPAARAGKPEDVARLIAFLASDLADYITGQVIGVDGGMIA